MKEPTDYSSIIKKKLSGISKTTNNDNSVNINYKSSVTNLSDQASANAKKVEGLPMVQLKVKISVTKNCKVCIKPSSKPLALILSKVSSASYDISENEWLIDPCDYDMVAKELIKNKFVFDKVPAGTITLAKKSISNKTYPLNGDIYDLLMDFQRESVYFAINRNGRILLADDMGLGKTVQALAIANYYSIEFPLLILCPASLCYNWYDSIRQFLNVQSSIIKEKSDFGERISIISYNTAVNYLEAISSTKFGVIICDECHYLKSTTSKRTKVLLPILQKASRLVLLSGTPATSRPVELYPILCALDKSLYPSFQAYGNRYCDAHKRGLFMDYRGCSNAVELSAVLEKAFMIRRTKDAVLGQLPKKFRRQIFLEVKKSNQIKKPDADRFIGESPDNQIMLEYKEASITKQEPVKKYIEDLIEKDLKFLIFAHHKEMLDSLESTCVDKKVKYIRIDGSTLSSKRQALVEQFQKDTQTRVAVLSLTACSTGLTLTEGKAVIFAELYWNPGVMLQAEDRIHRIGQIDNVDIHYLVAKNTIDEIVWPKILKKLNVLESLGIGKNELKSIKGTAVEDGFQGRLEFKKRES